MDHFLANFRQKSLKKTVDDSLTKIVDKGPEKRVDANPMKEADKGMKDKAGEPSGTTKDRT